MTCAASLPTRTAGKGAVAQPRARAGLRQASPGASEPADAKSTRKRLVYLDNLKVFLVAGVIATHATAIYGPGGGWIYTEHPHAYVASIALGIVGLLGSLFWLGLFFLLAGMVTPGSLRRRGLNDFTRERLLRLGLPLVVYIVIVMPLTKLLVAESLGQVHTSPINWTVNAIWPLDAGVLWFVAALLVFSSAYALWHALGRRARPSESTFGVRHLLAVAASICLLTFLARLEWPMATHQFLSLHLWQWGQFVVLFLLGAEAADRGWLRALPNRIWWLCGAAVLAATAVGIVLVMEVLYGPLQGQQTMFSGGWHWQALVAAALEGLIAVGGSLFVLDLFRRVCDHPMPMRPSLIRSQYGAYVIQVPIIVAFALALRLTAMPSDYKFLIVAPVAIIVSFGLAGLLVRIPLVARIL